MKRTHILVILDGWGIGNLDETNPIFVAQLNTFKELEQNFPVLSLQASGIAVGLPWNEEGNSEVGHLTIGSGRIIYQHFPRISLAIDDGTFFQNQVLKNAFNHAKQFKSKVHIIGLLTSGTVHAALKHLFGLIKMAKLENYSETYLHLFTDGRDSPPKSFLDLFNKVLSEIEKNDNICRVKTIIGRYYAMNREENWDRTEKAYKALLGEGENIELTELENVIKEHYQKGLDDEFVRPLVLIKGPGIEENDSLIFFNFREDSMRQIFEPFVNPGFNYFPIKEFKNLYVASLTEYNSKYNNYVAFPNLLIKNTLGEILALNQKNQLRIAETEKYAHITYFFNGLVEKPFSNEFRVLIPSLSVSRIDEYPEMRASLITDRALTALNENNFDFVLINYANPDIIAHTGNYGAAIKAVKVIDKEIERLVKTVLANDYLMIITSDHGNVEQLFDPLTGQPETKHNTNPVPIYFIAKEFKKQRLNFNFQKLREKPIGVLADIAPTILEFMKLTQPKEMTGISLLSEIY